MFNAFLLRILEKAGTWSEEVKSKHRHRYCHFYSLARPMTIYNEAHKSPWIISRVRLLPILFQLRLATESSQESIEWLLHDRHELHDQCNQNAAPNVQQHSLYPGNSIFEASGCAL